MRSLWRCRFLGWHGDAYGKHKGKHKMNWIQTWATPVAILLSGFLVAASILFVDRWQISATGYGYGTSNDQRGYAEDTVYRLNRWTGKIDRCEIGPTLQVWC